MVCVYLLKNGNVKEVDLFSVRQWGFMYFPSERKTDDETWMIGWKSVFLLAAEVKWTSLVGWKIISRQTRHCMLLLFVYFIGVSVSDVFIMYLIKRLIMMLKLEHFIEMRVLPNLNINVPTATPSTAATTNNSSMTITIALPLLLVVLLLVLPMLLPYFLLF